ncbi:MAG: TIGR02147 family protein [Chitinispirillaceae bacterium]
MVSVFDYLDFRKFLKDYFEEQKSLQDCFSYKYLSNKAGLRNKGFLYNIVNGSKKLSTSNIFKLSSAMELGKKEAAYFENLVFFNQASSAVERDHFFRQMESFKEHGAVLAPARTVRKDQYELYSKWYHSAMRALVGMNPDKKEFQWLGRQLHPAITGREARRSLSLLVRLGLLRQTAKAGYELCDPLISTGHEVKNVALLNFYLQHLALASDALKNVPSDKRRFEGITLGISKKSYDKICKEFESFVQKALSIAAEDKEADRVYQLMLQLYPLTRNATSGGTRNE